MKGMKTKFDLPRGGGSHISRLRLTAVAPFLFAVVACVLSIILLVSGTKPGTLQDYNIMALNTLKIGETIIQYSPTTPAVAKVKRDTQDNSLDPFAILPTVSATTTSSGPGPTSSSSPLDFFSALATFFSGIVNNVTASIDKDLDDAEAQLVAGVVSSLGIAQYYALHMFGACSGTMSSSGSFDANNCVSYSDQAGGLLNLTHAIPPSLQVEILSSLSTSGTYLADTVTTLTKILNAFYISSLVGSCITAFASLTSILFSKSWILLYINLISSILAVTFLLLGAITLTIVAEFMTTIVNKVGNGVGLYAERGDKFIAITWVSFAMTALACGFWTVVWFVEFKQSSVLLRPRAPEQRGNYSAILREMKGNLIYWSKEKAPKECFFGEDDNARCLALDHMGSGPENLAWDEYGNGAR